MGGYILTDRTSDIVTVSANTTGITATAFCVYGRDIKREGDM